MYIVLYAEKWFACQFSSRVLSYRKKWLMHRTETELVYSNITDV